MSSTVTDTHALVWYVNDTNDLSVAALNSFEAAEQSGSLIYVPAIVLVELRYLVEKARDITERDYQTIVDLLKNSQSAVTLAPLDLAVAEAFADSARNCSRYAGSDYCRYRTCIKPAAGNSRPQNPRAVEHRHNLVRAINEQKNARGLPDDGWASRISFGTKCDSVRTSNAARTASPGPDAAHPPAFASRRSGRSWPTAASR